MERSWASVFGGTQLAPYTSSLLVYTAATGPRARTRAVPPSPCVGPRTVRSSHSHIIIRPPPHAPLRSAAFCARGRVL